MLKKRDRLTVDDIAKLSQGKSVFGTLISLRFMPAATTKYAVTASKKVAKNAVDRNRLRRRVYGALERADVKVAKPAYIMLMPKRECLDIPMDALREEVASLFKKAGL